MRAARDLDGFALAPLDWQALLRDGVPEVEYIDEPYFPKLARVWIWGATGSYKSLYCAFVAARLSRGGVRVFYFSEENPIGEELRRLDRLRPDPEHFRIFHRSGMDLANPLWIDALLAVTKGDDVVFLDSWTDLWAGDENDNRSVQLFDAAVLKPLQAQGVTPVVLHHTGHRQMFSERGGSSAGRGASSLGQKADVTLEFKDAGENRFTIVYGKCRIGGIRQPERCFAVEDTADGRVEIVEAGSPEEHAVEELAEKMAQAILTVDKGFLTSNELRTVVGGRRERQAAAQALLENDARVRMGVEKTRQRTASTVTPKSGELPTGTPLGSGCFLTRSASEVVNCAPLKGRGAVTHLNSRADQPRPYLRGALGAYLNRGDVMVRTGRGWQAKRDELGRTVASEIPRTFRVLDLESEPEIARPFGYQPDASGTV